MKTSIKITVLFLLVIVVSCGQRTGQKSDNAEKKHTREFPMVTPPAMIQEPQEIMEYLAMHYWDGLLAVPETEGKTYLCDSLHVSGVGKGDFEQGLANYIYILENLPLKTAQKAVRQMASRVQDNESADTSSNIFETFAEMAEKYMFDPNSPLRNEDLYSPFAAALSQSQHLDPAARKRYAYVAEMCRLNEKGSKAADFRFCDKSGHEYTLYGIEAPYTLLFFSNPGCQSCLEIINTLKNDPKVAGMIADRTLAVLNIYIDEDLQAWREYMPIYPKEWYNGFNPDLAIRTEKTYSVRAIPSLYLLDSSKTVILKDATPERLFQSIELI